MPVLNVGTSDMQAATPDVEDTVSYAAASHAADTLYNPFNFLAVKTYLSL